MNRFKLLTILALGIHGPASAAEPEATGIRAIHRHGQTFVTWKDAAEGEEGAKYRYSLYRWDRPITADNLQQAELCCHGVLNNSARLFGTAFNLKDRLDPSRPYSVIEEGGQPLAPWSGLAVHTVRKEGKAYYAVVATDQKLNPLSRAVPGKSATTEPISEMVAPVQPIKLLDSKSRGPYSPQTSLTGQKGLPLRVELHASQGQGGGAGEYGDYYLYFATPEMGYRDGLPGVFSVEERREKDGNYLLLRSRDAIEHPSGLRAMETYWFGYLCVPQLAAHREPRAYPYTERRMEWIVDWVVRRYNADPERVYASGGSMGAWGSTTYALRHPERFAAVYPNRPRTRQRGLPSLVGALPKGQPVLMDDGKTDYFARLDMVKFAAEHAADLPFYGWCCGRRDGFATWQEQVDMVKALTSARHGFAFAWNDGDHSSGSQPMAQVMKYYPPQKFARNQSYPALGNSSIDQKLGNGDAGEGDPEGGINLGFRWDEVVDEPDRWSVRLANDLAREEMTVDVTPRRCQKFKPRPGSEVRWSSSLGESGKATIDAAGLVTVPRLKLRPGAQVVLTLSRSLTATEPGPGLQGEVPLPEGWDYAGPMKKVAAQFRGQEGVVIHVGGSMTIANPYGTWARSGKGKMPEDEAILRWMHTEKKDKSDGWWLCRTEVVHYRAHTAESGLKSAMLFDGGKRGLPTLAKMLDDYKPRMVTIECGIYDIEDGVPLNDYRKNMGKALDQILDRGAIPILNTIPPFQAQLERTRQFNEALRALAKERGIPVIDLEREILTRRPEDWFGTLMKRIHLTAAEAGGSPAAEPTSDNLRQSGYLLRSWLTVRKIAEVKRRVLDPAK